MAELRSAATSSTGSAGACNSLPTLLRSVPRPDSPTKPAEGPVPFKELDTTELKLLERLDTGGLVEVFKAVWHNEVVAVKQLGQKVKDRWASASRAARAARVSFVRERAILTKVQHPNLLQLLGVCLMQSQMRIAIEFCKGDSCFKLLHSCGGAELSWWQRLKICSDVAAGMNYLHQFTPQIIHRDLKSTNLLLVKEMRLPSDTPLVKISDFSVARARDRREPRSMMTARVGTMRWMAPEVYLGELYNEKVDVYSFGIFLFEIAAQEMPFQDEFTEDIGHLIIDGQRPDLRHLLGGCPDLLRTLMQSCWAGEPDERPAFHSIAMLLNAAVMGIADGALGNAFLRGLTGPLGL